jgi:hypothetical protein
MLNVPKVTRRVITDKLLLAATYYYVKKNYSVYREIGVKAWGSRRVDLVTFDTKGMFVGCEIKSCASDYKADTKWYDYLQIGVFDKFYFVIPQKLFDSKFYSTIKEDLKREGVGIMVLMEHTGTISVVLNAKTRDTDISSKRKLIVKLAWRGGDSRHNIKRIQRVSIGA